MLAFDISVWNGSSSHDLPVGSSHIVSRVAVVWNAVRPVSAVSASVRLGCICDSLR